MAALLFVALVAQSGPSQPSPAALKVGDVVEVNDRLLYDDLTLFRGRPGDGVPPGSVHGTHVSGIAPGTLAVLVAFERGAVQVRLRSGNWDGRTGWVRPEAVRRYPTRAEAEADRRHGLGQFKRREIYQAIHKVGMDASAKAAERFPLKGEATSKSLEEHRLCYEEARFLGLKRLAWKYKLVRAKLDAIRAEGDVKGWNAG